MKCVCSTLQNAPCKYEAVIDGCCLKHWMKKNGMTKLKRDYTIDRRYNTWWMRTNGYRQNNQEIAHTEGDR